MFPAVGQFQFQRNIFQPSEQVLDNGFVEDVGGSVNHIRDIQYIKRFGEGSRMFVHGVEDRNFLGCFPAFDELFYGLAHPDGLMEFVVKRINGGFYGWVMLVVATGDEFLTQSFHLVDQAKLVGFDQRFCRVQDRLRAAIILCKHDGVERIFVSISEI